MELKITIPTDLSEITLEQYQNFLKAVADNEDEYFIMQKMLQYFCDIPLNISSSIPHKDVIEIVTKLNKLLAVTPELVTTFEMNGVKFGFEPSLDEISITAYADIDGYINSWETMHKAMAVLYRPIVKEQFGKYLIEPYNGTEQYGELMKQAPVNIALGASVFFYTLGTDLLKATLLSMEKNKQIMSSLKNTNLPNNGDGIQPYMHLLEETLLNLTNFPKFKFTKLLRG